MGLSSSMWTSVSGLMAHGNKMNVVGNNIANVSTVAYKGQRVDFSDYLYTDGGSVSGTTQIGQGVSTYAVLGDYSQGSFESTNSVTDLGIDGNGYFQVRKTNSEQMYYSRAGDFYFNNNRELQNPQGYVLQGWKVNNDKTLNFNSGSTNLNSSSTSESAYVGSGTPTDIVLDSWNIPPQRTTNVKFTMGLTNNGTGDKTTSSTSPMTALFDLWDGTSNPPLAKSSYSANSDIKVYDEGGNSHTLTVYYDQVDASKTDSSGNTIYSIDGLPAGYSMYEYMVTIPPSEDQRSYGGKGYDPATNTWATEPTKFYNDQTKGTSKQAGVLMSGVMIFDGSGRMVNQTAYTYGATETPNPNDQVSVDPASKTSWEPTKISSNGLPTFSANFTGQPLANSVSETMQTGAAATSVSQVQNYITELDLGVKSVGTPAWNNPTTTSVKTNALGQPVDAGGNALGMNKYGYYTLATGVYGTTNTVVAPVTTVNVKADSTGYYYVNGASKNVYGGTAISLNGAAEAPVEALNNGSGYYFVDTSNAGASCYNTTEVSGRTTPAYSDSYGSYYKDPVTTNNVYGTDPSSNLIFHDTGGYYYLTGMTHNYVTTADFTKITTSTFKPESYVAPDDPTRPTPAMVTGNNNLSSLTTVSKLVGTNSNGVPIFKNIINYGTSVATMTKSEVESSTSVDTSTTWTVQNHTQDGYASGTLSNVKINESGVVSGVYSNGQTLPLYQIAMYDFDSAQGLYREGNNLFSATKESGEANLGVAGDNGFGSIKAYSLEQSNVDMSREFVQMITAQRGFQANSKGITTVDTMLETVIGMKR